VACSGRAQGRIPVAVVLLAAALLLAAGSPVAAAPAPAPITVDAGNGSTLRVESAPFRLAVLDGSGRETVATVAGREGPPVRVPGIDGPLPLEPLGPLGGFPALGFVTGARAGATFPVSFFTGNRLFGAETGALVSVVEVLSSEPTADGAHLRVRTDAPGLGPATLAVRRLPAGGVTLHLQPPAGLRPVSTVFTLKSPADEGLYGLGGRKDAFDQRGRLRNVWVEQQNVGDERTDGVPGADPTGTTGREYTFPNGAQAAYYVQPALNGSRGWAAWVGGSALNRVDLAASRGDAIRWGVASPDLTLSLAGGGLEQAARSQTAASGRGPAPPRYAYEPWLDVINESEGEAAPNGAGFNGGARVKRELTDIAAKARRLDVPIGTLGVEGWQSVPGGRDFFAGLRRQGFHLSAYWNPFTSRGTPAYEEALALGIFIKDAKGDPYPIVTNRGGQSFVIDYSNPRAWEFWKRQIDRSSSLGFEAFMHDFGEFVTEGMTFHDGRPPDVMHNAYPALYHRAARQALDGYARSHPGFEPFFYVRAGHEGVAASTPGVFPGDESTDFSEASGLPSVAPAMLNLAMGGSFAFTTDVGGYLDLIAPQTSAELFTRWSQLAAFTAISRVHDSTFKGSVYPWDFDRATLDTYRRYAKAKVRLIPTVDRWAKRAAADGTIGPVRPLVLDDSSPAARSIDDEWLLGRDVLVAPVLRRGARSRSVYLPAGSDWQRVRVGDDGRLRAAASSQRGGQRVQAPAPLADIPLYVRRAAAAPQRPQSDAEGGGGAKRKSVAAPDRGNEARRAVTATTGHTRDDGQLPFTGLGLAAVVAAGLMLVGAGVLTSRVARRRRPRMDPGG